MIISLFITGLAIGGIYGLLALSLVLINKATEVVNFGQGEMGMWGAFAALSLLSWTHWPLPIIFLIAIVFSFVCGALIERVLIRPISRDPHLNILIVTIGLWFVLNSSAGWIWGYDPYRFPSLLPSETVTLAGALVSPNGLAVIGVALALMVVLYVFFEHTREGTAMRAASSNLLAARLMGIKVARVSWMSWAIASALSVVSAMLIAPLTFLDQQMMVPIILKAFAGAILGGFTSLPGAVLGSLLLGVAETLFGAYVSSAFKDALVFSLVILVLMFRPQGLFGHAIRKKV